MRLNEEHTQINEQIVVNMSFPITESAWLAEQKSESASTRRIEITSTIVV